MNKVRKGEEVVDAENIPSVLLAAVPSNAVPDTGYQDQLFPVLLWIFNGLFARFTVIIRVGMVKPVGDPVRVPEREKNVRESWAVKAKQYAVPQTAIENLIVPLAQAIIDHSSNYQEAMRSNSELLDKTRVFLEDLRVRVIKSGEKSTTDGDGEFNLLWDILANGEDDMNLGALRRRVDWTDWPIINGVIVWLLGSSWGALHQEAPTPEVEINLNWQQLAQERGVPKEAVDIFFLPICRDLERLGKEYQLQIQGSKTERTNAEKFVKKWQKAARVEGREATRQRRKLSASGPSVATSS